jgi:hypothetical protein
MLKQAAKKENNEPSDRFPEETLTNKYMPVVTCNSGFQGENAL